MVLSPTASLLIEAARRKSISRLNPWLEGLPEKFQVFYPRQADAIRQINQAFDDGQRLVVLEGPTGSGKTIIAEVVRRLQRAKAVYLCTTKSLQEQFCQDFPYGVLIKGRGNYPTGLYPERFKSDGLSCADCTKSGATATSCQWCKTVSDCPYERVKRSAVKADLAVANTAYFLTECNSSSKLSIRGRELVIADEADRLDDQLLKYASLKVSARSIKKYGLRVPKVTVEADWRDWVVGTLPVIGKALSETHELSLDIEIIRERNYLVNLLDKLKMLAEGLEQDKWIYSGDRENVEFKPVWVDQVANRYLWEHGKKWLLMSATIGNADELVKELGWEQEYQFVGMPSTFKAENRRVIGKPVANMAYKNKSEGRTELVRATTEIIDKYPEHRILVHTVSYDLTGYMHTELAARLPNGRALFSYRSASGRQNSLKQFRKSRSGILLAPSLDRGIDLPDDACRVQIIAKVPFPNVGDKQIAARLYGSGKRGRQWYTMETIRTIVQMCGRAVRNEDDWCVTYVLDNQFLKFFAEYGHWFPGGRNGWWKEGLRWEY